MLAFALVAICFLIGELIYSWTDKEFIPVVATIVGVIGGICMVIFVNIAVSNGKLMENSTDSYRLADLKYNNTQPVYVIDTGETYIFNLGENSKNEVIDYDKCILHFTKDNSALVVKHTSTTDFNAIVLFFAFIKSETHYDIYVPQSAIENIVSYKGM